RGPTGFLTRRVEKWVGDRLDRSGILGEARTDLARFVGARPEDLVFVRNATSGLNAVIRSLRLRREEEALTTSHEYGAILRTWEFVGANLVLCSSDTLIER